MKRASIVVHYFVFAQYMVLHYMRDTVYAATNGIRSEFFFLVVHVYGMPSATFRPIPSYPIPPNQPDPTGFCGESRLDRFTTTYMAQSWLFSACPSYDNPRIGSLALVTSVIMQMGSQTRTRPGSAAGLSPLDIPELFALACVPS